MFVSVTYTEWPDELRHSRRHCASAAAMMFEFHKPVNCLARRCRDSVRMSPFGLFNNVPFWPRLL